MNDTATRNQKLAVWLRVLSTALRAYNQHTESWECSEASRYSGGMQANNGLVSLQTIWFINSWWIQNIYFMQTAFKWQQIQITWPTYCDPPILFVLFFLLFYHEGMKGKKTVIIKNACVGRLHQIILPFKLQCKTLEAIDDAEIKKNIYLNKSVRSPNANGAFSLRK